jgi:N-acyl-D-amino-acid deacylase
MIRITDGMIADGSGATPVRNPGISIIGEHIRTGKDALNGKSSIEISAKGMVISPGFMDAHSHSDIAVLVNPKAENRILQGITTEVTGNCGFTPFPVTALNREPMSAEYRRSGIRLSWNNVAEYASVVNRRKPAVNIAPLIGHGNLRSAAMGYSSKAPSAAQLKRMKGLLDQNLRMGAFGLSSGLEYTPSGFADWKELAELCTVVAKFKRVYATHMRNEDGLLEESVDESLKVSRKSKAWLEISHLKATRKANWGKVKSVLSNLERRAGRGERVMWDAYPYTASHTDLTIALPKHIMDGGFKSMLNAIANSATRKLVKDEMESARDDDDWRAIVVEDITGPDVSRFSNMNVLDIAREMDVSPVEAVFRLLENNGHDIAIIVHNMAEDDVDTVFSSALTGIGSDSSIYTGGHPHPRAFGTFPKAFRRYVRELNFCSVQGMVRKASALTAERFGISGRGYIRDGYFADIVIFDPVRIEDKSTYEAPTITPVGIEYVIVNGVLEVNGGKITGKRGGRVLRA